jgi:hypothetical protein
VRGEIMTTGLGVKLSETPGHVTRPPLVGEHTTHYGPRREAAARCGSAACSARRR